MAGKGPQTVASIDPRILSALENWPLPERAKSPAEIPQPDEGPLQIDIEEHPEVLKFVQYYGEENHNGFRRALARSTAYLPMIRKIFHEEGVPEDLAYLALIESGFNPTARSPMGAAGLWQFMRGTACKKGLRMDWWVDERMDPEESTRAAARYLKELYEIFGSWDLAIAAYNAGDGKISSCLKRENAESFWDIRRYRDLNRESKDFLPRFLAAAKVAKDPEAYGYTDIPYEEAQRFDSVKLGPAVGGLDLETIARLSGTTQQEIRALNPQFKRWCTPPGPSEVKVRLPKGSAQRFLSGLSKLPPEKRLNVLIHRVANGETLGEIARRYGSRTDLIQRMNRLRSVGRIRAGSQILIPVDRRQAGRDDVEVPSDLGRDSTSGTGGQTVGVSATQGAVVHEVKRGETLWDISRKYGVQVSDIRRWNKLQGQLIRPGDTLVLLKKNI